MRSRRNPARYQHFRWRRVWRVEPSTPIGTGRPSAPVPRGGCALGRHLHRPGRRLRALAGHMHGSACESCCTVVTGTRCGSSATLGWVRWKGTTSGTGHTSQHIRVGGKRGTRRRRLEHVAASAGRLAGNGARNDSDKLRLNIAKALAERLLAC